MSKAIDASIIILNYNTRFWLKKCLSSLEDRVLPTTKSKIEVIVVDNNSSDGSQELVKSEFPRVKLLTLATNDGFAAGNNQALKIARGRYQALCNSDIEFEPETNLDEMISYLDSKPEVGVLTPRIELTTGEIDPGCHRGEPTLLRSFFYFSGLAGLFPKHHLINGYHLGHLDLTQTHQVEACSGAFMMVRQSVIEEVGLLDEQFFMYAEDLDWCKRIREAGHMIVFYPHTSLTHHKYKSGLASQSTKVSQKTRNYFYDTMGQYYDKHYAGQYPTWLNWLVKKILIIKKRIA